MCEACLEPGKNEAGAEPAPHGRPMAKQALRSSPISRALKGQQQYDDYERVGAFFEYGFLAVRCVLYIAFFVLAQRSEIVRLAFQGFLIADIAAWFVQAIFEVRRQAKNVIVELFFLGVVYLYFTSRGLPVVEMPELATDRAVVGLVFVFYFSTRVIFYVLRYRYDRDEDQGIT